MQKPWWSEQFPILGVMRAAVLVAGAALLAVGASGQATFTPIYQFTGGANDGGNPNGPLVEDAAGNLYGTATTGGAYSNGTVFKLVNSGGSYTATAIYSFPAGGAHSAVGVVLDSAGNVYGTTPDGGANSKGNVFELLNNGDGTYTYTNLWSFAGTPDGQTPSAPVTLDAEGNLYGTVQVGGSNSEGAVFELMPNGGAYSERILYSFGSTTGDGIRPTARVTLDAAGDIFGTAELGGASPANGAAFELIKNGTSYSEHVLYSFTNGGDGSNPEAGVVLDANGNVYSTTSFGPLPANAGAVFELVQGPSPSPGQVRYTETTLHTFPSTSTDGVNPDFAGLVRDGGGDLIGATFAGGASGTGTVFVLSYSSGAYSYASYPLPSPLSGPEELLLDSGSNLFGISTNGGTNGMGTAWKFSVANTSTSLALVASKSLLLAGENVTFTATVTPAPTGPSTAGFAMGTVTFSVGSLVVGSALVSNNVASLTIPASTLGTGSVTVTAHYVSSGLLMFPSSASIVETVIPDNDLATLNGGNTFNGNQTVTGNVTATSFSGDGSALKNVTAAGLACAGCVGNAQLGVNYAGSSTQGGAAQNALMLGGFAPAAYALQGASNSFTGDQSIAGGLAATGNLKGANGNFAGSLTIGGGTAIAEYFSLKQAVKLPPIPANTCITLHTAALTGFVTGDTDTVALGVPASLMTAANGGKSPPVQLNYQAWEASAGNSPTIRIRVCTTGAAYVGGAIGNIRVDVFKH